MRDVQVPRDLWQTGEAAISAWFYADGDQVREDDVVAELMVEKSSFELAAPASGRLVILVAAEEAVSQGQVVGRIE